MKTIEVVFPIPVFKSFYYLAPENVQRFSRVKAPFGKRHIEGYVIGDAGSAQKGKWKLKEISRVIDSEPLLTPQLYKLGVEMSRYYLSPLGEVLGVILPSFIKEYKRKRSLNNTPVKHEKKQSGIPDYIKNALSSLAEEKGKSLIHRGSYVEKNLIYKYFISCLVKRGEGVILLVPEIAFTGQITNTFLREFNSSGVDIWHSKVPPGRKMEIIKRLKKGKTKILIGTRSAVFAPIKNLGAVIVDEEQDQSYKDENSPYYDARWAAEKRCDIEKARLLLSSATPSVENFYRARKKEISYVKITRPQENVKKNEVTVVDMKREKGWMFSRYLLNKIENNLKEKRRALIFVNRKGFSHSIVCSKCGENLKCPRCSINLSLRSGNQEMNCHVCSYSTTLPQECPHCGGAVFKYRGYGSERAEKALKKMFPESKVDRLDLNSVRKKSKQKKIYEDFINGKTDILIGTSLITAGLDFPDASLRAILNADTLLFLPDFRAAEKNYTFLRRLSFRGSEAERKSEVVIQSFNPGSYSIKFQMSENYLDFYKEEIEIRKNCGFPPFKSLINIICSHRKPENAKKTAFHVKDFVEKNISGVEILGPSEAPRYKIRGNFRWQVMLKRSSFSGMYERFRDLKISRPVKSVKIKFDVDPYDML
ncbi:MAG: replication restart helicase PriA [Elusimicrobiota bacterium]